MAGAFLLHLLWATFRSGRLCGERRYDRMRLGVTTTICDRYQELEIARRGIVCKIASFNLESERTLLCINK